MKIAIPFMRSRSRRKASKPHHEISNWTTRDWADLPVHHPKAS